MINFYSILSLFIPEGEVIRILSGTNILWEKITTSYKNWVRYSQNSKGEIYNNIGFRNGYYASSTGVDVDTNDDNAVTTGYIQYNLTESGGPIIRIKGVELITTGSAASHYGRFVFAQGESTNKEYFTYKYGTTIETYFSISYVDGVYTLTPSLIYKYLIENGWDISKQLWFRLSLKGTGNNLIITLDEEL